jgi:hypothetical protein
VAKYESKIIYEFAERLYSRANSIVVVYVLVGLLAGGVSGYAIGFASGNSAIAGSVLAVLLGGLGYMMGTERAFQLKLQAQTALCHVQIEENTRSRVASEPSPQPRAFR